MNLRPRDYENKQHRFRNLQSSRHFRNQALFHQRLTTLSTSATSPDFCPPCRLKEVISCESTNAVWASSCGLQVRRSDTFSNTKCPNGDYRGCDGHRQGQLGTLALGQPQSPIPERKPPNPTYSPPTKRPEAFSGIFIAQTRFRSHIAAGAAPKQRRWTLIFGSTVKG